jgi:DNA polymerase bacteriophage-type
VTIPAAHLDFESRSTIDLKAVGVHIYAAHPTTDIWCAAYAIGDDPPGLWRMGEPMPYELRAHVAEGGEIRCYNAQFERIMWREVLHRRYGWPMPKLEQFHCVMARAYAMGLPGTLEGAAAAVGIQQQKDMAGHRLMMQMCRPRSVNGDQIIWWDDPEKLKRLGDYCRQDLIVERDLDKRLLHLPPIEQRVYYLDQIINDRGVRIDRALAGKAIKVVAATAKKLDAEMREVTQGFVGSPSQVQQLVIWLKAQGVETDSVSKDTLAKLLDNPRIELPAAARRALEIRREAAKTSVAKLESMLTRSTVDGRMRGNLQYHGAGTGRWAARGAQLQNLPRPSLKQKAIEAAIGLIEKENAEIIDMIMGPPLSVVSDCIRSVIIADKGKDIIAADFSNIEGRGVAWLAGETWKLDAFRAFDRKEGPDLYLVAAGRIYDRPASDFNDKSPERQVGKVAELALGYQGGVGAFQNMAKNYRVDMAPAFETLWRTATPLNRDKALDAYEERGKRYKISREAWLASELTKLAWRDAHPNIVRFWQDLEAAAIDATLNPGKVTTASTYIKFLRRGSFLFCRLPSGRALCYPYPKVEWAETPWGTQRPALSAKGVDGITKKWGDYHVYGGLLAENVTQAVARDLMAEAMLRVEAAGYEVVLTVHDEVVCEVSEVAGNVEEFNALMSELPTWASGCPVTAAGWRGKRYKK